MAIPKKTLRTIQSALDAAQRTYDYLHNPELIVAYKRKRASTSLDYTHTDGSALTVVEKHSSHIVGIEDTIRTLRNLLAMEAAKA